MWQSIQAIVGVNFKKVCSILVEIEKKPNVKHSLVAFSTIAI
jgi:hypothetical protein